MTINVLVRVPDRNMGINKVEAELLYVSSSFVRFSVPCEASSDNYILCQSVT